MRPITPASSWVSRRAVCSAVSPSSTWPLGKIQTLGIAAGFDGEETGLGTVESNDDGAGLLNAQALGYCCCFFASER